MFVCTLAIDVIQSVCCHPRNSALMAGSWCAFCRMRNTKLRASVASEFFGWLEVLKSVFRAIIHVLQEVRGCGRKMLTPLANLRCVVFMWVYLPKQGKFSFRLECLNYFSLLGIWDLAFFLADTLEVVHRSMSSCKHPVSSYIHQAFLTALHCGHVLINVGTRCVLFRNTHSVLESG